MKKNKILIKIISTIILSLILIGISWLLINIIVLEAADLDVWNVTDLIDILIPMFLLVFLVIVFIGFISAVIFGRD